MLLDEFQEYLDRYGATLADWPVALRTEAQQLCLRDPLAGQAMATAQRLRVLIQDLPDAPVSAALWERLTSIPQRHPQLSLAGLWVMLGSRGRWGGAVGMTAAFALGVWLGIDPNGAAGEGLPGFEAWGIM